MTLFFVRDFFGFYNTFVHFFLCLLFCFFLLFSLRKFCLLSIFSLSVLKFSFFSHIPFYTYILVSFHICSLSRHYFCSLLSSFLSLFTLFNSLTSIFYSLCFLLSSLPFSLCFTFVCVNVKRKSFLLYFIPVVRRDSSRDNNSAKKLFCLRTYTCDPFEKENKRISTTCTGNS